MATRSQTPSEPRSDRQSINIFGDGQQTRDYTFVQDIVAANLAARKVPAMTTKLATQSRIEVI